MSDDLFASPSTAGTAYDASSIEVLEGLEADRRLLAEAWERLEQLQVQYEPRASPEPVVSAPSPPPAAASAAASARADDDENDPMTRAILRQFQVLSNDVRRAARGKGGR